MPEGGELIVLENWVFYLRLPRQGDAADQQLEIGVGTSRDLV